MVCLALTGQTCDIGTYYMVATLYMSMYRMQLVSMYTVHPHQRQIRNIDRVGGGINRTSLESIYILYCTYTDHKVNESCCYCNLQDVGPRKSKVLHTYIHNI